MARDTHGESGRRSIFRSVFVPLFFVMLLQAAIFYLAAVYGGIEGSLSQNAADILSERMLNRKNELETQLNGRCFALGSCESALRQLYADYEEQAGPRPLAEDPERQIQYLAHSADLLVDTLRHNEVNGVFLILNDSRSHSDFDPSGEKRYGLCIRDIDQNSSYSGREDLVLERSPSSLVDALGCSLDSWWEARYSFDTEAQGDYYYFPLEAAWTNPGAKGTALAYLSGAHRLSGSDQSVVSYSIPLMAEDGYPFGVLGVELTVKHLSSLIPLEGGDQGDSCYILALRHIGSDDCLPIVGVGSLYSRCFGGGGAISTAQAASTGGFQLTARGDTQLYGDLADLDIYDNNNPFENNRLVLLTVAESDSLFAYIGHIKTTLLVTSLICLAIGVVGILLVSRRFAMPIKALAERVRNMKPRAGEDLGRVGISEIDQLVDSIEELNRNVNRGIAKTEFFSRMSHDMRTPMNAIISFSSPELLEGTDEATKADYLDKIHSSGDYLLGLINEVLDMTRIESSKVELRPASVQALRLCDTTLPIIEKLAQTKRVMLDSRVIAPPELYLMVDSQYFDQIVMNLLSNAVKFSHEGGLVRFEVRAADPGSDGKVPCRIVVADQGIGMSPEFMKILYEPFEQENSAKEGSGLGLSIVKSLVELMGGSIHCDSEKGRGTTFTVLLPLAVGAAEDAKEPGRELSSERAELKVLRGKRLLVCEDNQVNTEIVCRLLEKTGIITVRAENGQLGLEAFAASEPGYFDAVLMDVRMPVMDGLAATRAIRALPREDAARLPIIAMTANAFEEDVRASDEAGMNEHLAKPIDTRRFYDALLKYLAPPP